MKEAAILIVLLLGFSHLQMTSAFFLDPFGLFENEAIEQETIVFEDEEITLKDTRTADFNSSFLVVGKSIYSSFEFYTMFIFCAKIQTIYFLTKSL